MKYPAVKGQIFVQFSSNVGRPEVFLSADPTGLRSLAALCSALADVNQSATKGLPEQFASEHIHLKPGIHLGLNSVRLCLGRADNKQGNLGPSHEPRSAKAAQIASSKAWVGV